MTFMFYPSQMSKIPKCKKLGHMGNQNLLFASHFQSQYRQFHYVKKKKLKLIQIDEVIHISNHCLQFRYRLLYKLNKLNKLTILLQKEHSPVKFYSSCTTLWLFVMRGWVHICRHPYKIGSLL